MTNPKSVHALPFVLAFLLVIPPAMAAPNTAPKIDHTPVTLGIRGQSVVFRARVSGPTQAVKSVTLFYAVSRDAAPYRVAMNDSGAGVFTGSIPADMTAGLNQILYYIEARNEAGSTAETPWYTIDVKIPTGAQPEPAAVVAAPPAPLSPERTQSSWKKPALIAGGVLLVGGAALALSSGGGGGGGDSSSSSGGATTNAAGSYSGSATTCFQPPGSNATCSTRAIAIAIDGSGNVTSDSLRDGVHLAGKLSGANFLLVTPVQEAGLNGDIQFLGTVVDNRIAGSIQGTVTGSGGTGTYSGNFSAAK